MAAEEAEDRRRVREPESGSVKDDGFAFEVNGSVTNFCGTGDFGKRNTLVLHNISRTDVDL
jgi:hypothetical protein